jgi:hypothetical protein
VSGPRPRRRVPRIARIGVPVLALGLVLALVAVAWRSNQAVRVEQSRSPEVLPSVQTASDSFVGCTDCHGDLDKVFASGGAPNLLFTHAKHFAKGVSDCSVCHAADTHVQDKINKPTMSRCFLCHGASKDAIAPGACSTCHPAGAPTKPASHEDPKWVPSGHSKAALVDRFECLTCHAQSFCSSCHGLPLPHPSDWDTTHPGVFFKDPATCERCHPITEPQSRDFCDTCHHPQGPERIPWRQYHPTAVKDGTAMNCFQCHSELTCSGCHVRGVLDLSHDETKFFASPAPTIVPTPTPTTSQTQSGSGGST